MPRFIVEAALLRVGGFTGLEQPPLSHGRIGETEGRGGETQWEEPETEGASEEAMMGVLVRGYGVEECGCLDDVRSGLLLVCWCEKSHYTLLCSIAVSN